METPALIKTKERQKQNDQFPWGWDNVKLSLVTDRLLKCRTLWLANNELLEIKPQDKYAYSNMNRNLIRIARTVKEPIQRLHILRTTLLNQLHSDLPLLHSDTPLGQWVARTMPKLRRQNFFTEFDNLSEKLAKAARVDHLKQQLVEIAERKRLVQGAGLFIELEPLYGKAIYFIWKRMRSATLQKITVLISQGDIIPRDTLPRSLEWRLFDLLLLYDPEPFSILGPNCTELRAQSRALNFLFHLTQKHGAEESPHAWIHITKEYNSSGRIMSMVGLQRRWHEMKVAAVDALLQFWRITLYADRVKKIPEEKNRPPALYVAIAKRYPDVMLLQLPDWEKLVQSNNIVLSEYQCLEAFGPEDPDRKEQEVTVPVDEPFGNTAQDDDSVIFVDNEIEIIDLDEYNEQGSKKETTDSSSTHEVSPKVTEADTTQTTNNIFDIIDLSDDAVQAKVIIDDSDDEDWCSFYVNDQTKSGNEAHDKRHDIDKEIGKLDSDLRADIMQLNESNIKDPGLKTNVNPDLTIEETKNNNAPFISETVDNLSSGYVASNINVNHRINAIVKKEIELEKKLMEEEENKSELYEVNEEERSKNEHLIEDGNTEEVNKDIDEENTELLSNKSEDSDCEDIKPCIDLKLIMIPIVSILKIDQTQFWNNYSYKNQININDVNTNELAVKRKVEIDQSKSIDISSDDEVLAKKVKRMTEIPIKSTVINVSTHPLEAPRNILVKSTKIKSYNSISLCKNPDFNTRLKRLSSSFLLSQRNKELLNKCLPVTIDLVKSNIIYNHDTRKDSYKDLISDASDVLKPRAVPKIDLPDINYVRRMNKSLLTAEVTPFDAGVTPFDTGVAQTTESGDVELKVPEEDIIDLEPFIPGAVEKQSPESEDAEPEEDKLSQSRRRLVEIMDCNPKSRYKKSELSLRFNHRGDSVIAHSIKNPTYATADQPFSTFDRCSRAQVGRRGAKRDTGNRLRGAKRVQAWPHGDGWWRTTPQAPTRARLTEDTLQRILGRLQDVPLAVHTHQFCCLARRHRFVNDARRRNAEKLKRRYGGDRDIHSRVHSLDCSCCCLYLLSSDADIARSARNLDAEIQAVLDRRDKLKGDNNFDLNKADPEKDKDVEIRETVESKLLRETEIEKRRKIDSKYRKIQQKSQNKRRKTKEQEPEKEENQPLSDDYQEWIRQKNLASQVFGVKPRRITKESLDKTEERTGEKKTEKVRNVIKARVFQSHTVEKKHDNDQEKEKEKGISKKLYCLQPPPLISFRSKKTVNESSSDSINSSPNAKEQVLTKEQNDVTTEENGSVEDLTGPDENIVTSKEGSEIFVEMECKETFTESSKDNGDKATSTTSELTVKNLAEFNRSFDYEDSCSNEEVQANSDSDEEPALTIAENNEGSETETTENAVTAKNDMNLIISCVTSLAKTDEEPIANKSKTTAAVLEVVPIIPPTNASRLPEGTTLTRNLEKPAADSVVKPTLLNASVVRPLVMTRVIPAATSIGLTKKFKNLNVSPVRRRTKKSKQKTKKGTTGPAANPVAVRTDAKYNLPTTTGAIPPRILQGSVPPPTQLVPPPVLQGLADSKTVSLMAASLGPCADDYVKLFKPTKLWPLNPMEFIRGRDLTNIVLLQVDTSVPPWRVLGDTLILTETEESTKNPQYWNMGSSPRILAIPPPTPTAAGTSTRDFALFQKQSPLEAAPTSVSLQNKSYLKLCSEPLVYAQIVTLVNDIASVRRLLIAGARLQLYDPRTLNLTPLTSLAHQDNSRRIAVYVDGQKEALEVLISQLNAHVLAANNSGDKQQSFSHQLNQDDPIVIEDSDEETESTPNPRSLLKPFPKKPITTGKNDPHPLTTMLAKPILLRKPIITGKNDPYPLPTMLAKPIQPPSIIIKTNRKKIEISPIVQHTNKKEIKLIPKVQGKVPIAKTPKILAVASKTPKNKKQNLEDQESRENDQNVYPVKLTVGNVDFEVQEISDSEEILSDLGPTTIQTRKRQALSPVDSSPKTIQTSDRQTISPVDSPLTAIQISEEQTLSPVDSPPTAIQTSEQQKLNPADSPPKAIQTSERQTLSPVNSPPKAIQTSERQSLSSVDSPPKTIVSSPLTETQTSARQILSLSDSPPKAIQTSDKQTLSVVDSPPKAIQISEKQTLSPVNSPPKAIQISEKQTLSPVDSPPTAIKTSEKQKLSPVGSPTKTRDNPEYRMSILKNSMVFLKQLNDTDQKNTLLKEKPSKDKINADPSQPHLAARSIEENLSDLKYIKIQNEQSLELVKSLRPADKNAADDIATALKKIENSCK